MATVASPSTPRRMSDTADDAAGPGCLRSPRLPPRRVKVGAPPDARGRGGLDEPTPGSAASGAFTPRRATVEVGTPRRQASGAAAGGSSPSRGHSVERRLSAEAKGDVTLCVRLRPGPQPDVCVTAEPKADGATADSKDRVRLRAAAVSAPPGAVAGRYDANEVLYRCDHVFGSENTQEDIYSKAVAPITEAVMRGYNGAVIAYGQTGAGKTHTMVGSGTPEGLGVAPRAVAAIFAALESAKSWMVAVTALEIYNERVRDLLSPNGAANVEIHEHCSEDQRQSFRCPDATIWPARSPAEALAALAEVVRRRETASTDMNHLSSRSHLVFTVCVWQGEPEESGALHSRLHLVDLAGSERLKRSGESAQGAGTPGIPTSAWPAQRSSGSTTPSTLRSPRRSLGGGSSRPSSVSVQQRPKEQQRREAVDINKSLSQLALVIQRLTTPGPPQYVPYRDSMLTRLLAESFGGSSKTCLIINCSPLMEDREETRISLDFGRRAKLVRNRPSINVETKEQPAAVVKAFKTGEFPAVQALPRPRPSVARQASAPAARVPTPEDELQQHPLVTLIDVATSAVDLSSTQDQLQQHPLLTSADAATSAVDLEPLQDEPLPHPLVSSVDAATSATDLSPVREQAEAPRGADLSLLLPQLLSSQLPAQGSGAQGAGPEDSLLREALAQALAQAASAQAEAAELRQRLEAEAAEKCQLRARVSALFVGTGDARPSASSRRAAEEALRLEEEKAETIMRFEEQIQALRRGWQSDVARLEQAAEVKRRKATLMRRCQEDTAQLQEAHVAALAEAECQKNALRAEWQAARDEVCRLQQHEAAAEAQLRQLRAASAAEPGTPAAAEREPAARSGLAWPEVPALPRTPLAEESRPSSCSSSSTVAGAGEASPCTAAGPEDTEGLWAAGRWTPSAKRTCGELEASPSALAWQALAAEAAVGPSLEQVLYGAKAALLGGPDVAAGDATPPRLAAGRGGGRGGARAAAR